MQMWIYSSVLVIVLCVRMLFTAPSIALCGGHLLFYVSVLITHIICALPCRQGLFTNRFRSTGWDDDCDGLVKTIAREKEWEERERHNEAVQWGVGETGWGTTLPVSPVPWVIRYT
jgi:hypothetical protein